ncbi:hypothetical protein DYL61_16675 [Pseudomonas nabeulensis]|uniref:Uncharacterized protein n=2 Tax=Pseudomonas TaxID=286 RepID=A0A7X1XAN7_9PSED|nr:MULTISPECIES: hypothetical protein [Pseudomonas]MQT88065.1 hypothetical protein [Pseudomonas helleri]TFY92861.1 hypothetical protein DYL61_16675 [Pseudomonas nabeulensis]
MNWVLLQLQWLFNLRVARALLWTLLCVVLAIAANVVGIYFVGSIAGWERWLADAASYFMLWRLCLYGATGYGWIWMRRRLLAREPGTEARRRVIRAEVAGCIAIVALEASLLSQSM